jgi:hypothetical protein
MNGLMGGLGGLLKSVFGVIKRSREGNFEFNLGMTLVSLIEGAVAGIAIGFAIPSPLAALMTGAGIVELADLNDLIFPKK